MTKVFTWLLVLTAVLLLTVSSCTKTATEPDKPAVAASTATLDKTTAVPGEVVTITTSETLENKPSWAVTLGGQRVVLARISDKQAAFLVPVLPSGGASLDLAAVGVKEAKALTIGQYVAIQDPAPVYADFTAKLNVAVAYMEQLALDTSFPVSAQNLAVFKNMQQSLPAAYAASTAAQKLEAAYFMRQLTFTPLDFTTLAERTTGDPSEQFMNIGRKFVQQNILTVVGVAVVAVGVAAASPALAIAGGLFALYNLKQSLKAEETLINRTGVVASINTYTNRPANGTSSGLQLENGVPKNIRIEATYRTMQTADAQGGPFLQELMGNIDALKLARTRMQTALDQMRPSLAGSAATLSPFTDVKAQAATDTQYLPASSLLIGNISVPGITLGAAAQVGAVVTLTATSSSVTAVTPFTFDATYINGPLGVNVKKTFSAELVPPAPFTLSDIDGNTYRGVWIGSQRWMAENLKTTRYRDGTPLTEVTNIQRWVLSTAGSYASYANSGANLALYGRLYDGFASGSMHGLCPQGWHVPTQADWATLHTYVTGGAALKSRTGWRPYGGSGGNGSDAYGFNALPGGIVLLSSYGSLEETAMFWTSTHNLTSSPNDYYLYGLTYNIGTLQQFTQDFNFGASCRCVGN